MPIKWFIPWLFAFPLLKILTGIKINGSIPKKGPCIVACNHASALDPPVIGITACREVYFLAKVGLFNLSKFFTWLIRAYNAIPVTGIQGLRTAVRLLKKGKAVVIFPEGTRSRKGYILPFNPGVSYLAINLGVPVIPVYISNSNKKFISLILRINQLKIKFGKPVYPVGYKRDRENYDRFGAKLKEEIIKLR